MMITPERTSETHPIEVGWLCGPWAGRVGLTLAPGKQQLDAQCGPWRRNLQMDLERLRAVHGVEHLVCLLEDHELHKLAISDLALRAVACGLKFERMAFADGRVPLELGAVRELVARISGWAAAAETTVIHCMDGVGRAGTIGGCVLRAAGLSVLATFGALLDARGPDCPDRNEQWLYMRQFTAEAAAH